MRPVRRFVPKTVIRVNDKMQSSYTYTLDAKYGDVADEIKNAIPPERMLSEGVFSGKYMNDCKKEFPMEWYENGKFSTSPDISINRFKVKSRLSLPEWKRRGWIIEPDIRGWFQWWCRYYLGRRIPDVDRRNINRWKAYKRHSAQVKINAIKNKRKGDPTFRPKQRQGLLQWAHDPFPELLKKN